MNPREAAAVIGCCPRHVRALIQKGDLKAERLEAGVLITYNITIQEAKRYAQTKQSRGWPRGKKRG